MATQVNVGINVSDNGTTKKATEAAERLKQTYDAAGKSAKNIGAGPTMAGAAARATTSSELVDYNRQRAVSVGTGASARDFAKQSEGLGGLVRLYATFAANVFAVSAAFNALSTAMDTTNMIRGMDQLGASSGVALGSLSKRLVETTNGAVSLREAMEATVKAASAGIDSSSILRLGKVAQQASVALGVNASDALNRLSRGVIKLEPELLDELGIFTKIDPAVKAYARSVNKAVGDLTDFERRQAFLNAVIEEGEKKFSQINIDTNPYTKLSATLQNVLQNTLELINKGLAPLAGFLANSPGVLTAGLAGIATILLKQAIPAIGQVREGLRAAAEEAANVASGKAGQAVQARGILEDLLVQQVRKATDEQIQVVDASEQRILELKNGRIKKESALYKLMKKDIYDVEDADLEAARKQLANMGNRTAQQKELRTEVSKFITEVEKLRDATEIESAQEKKKLENTYIFRKVQQDAIDFEIKAKKDAIVSNASYTASLLGPAAGWKRLTAEIELADLKLTRFQRTAILTRGALAVLGGALTSVVDKLGKLFFYVGIITTAWSFLSGLFTNSGAAKLESELNNLNSTTDNLVNTFKKYRDTNAFSADSFKAQGAAVGELAASLKSLSTTATESFKDLGIFENFKSFFGFGAQAEFRKSFAVAISSTVKNLPEGKLKQEFLEKIQKIVPNLSSIQIGLGPEAISAQLGDTFGPASSTALDIVKATKDLGIELSNIYSRIEEVRVATDNAKTSAQELRNSYKIKSPIIDFAENSIVALEKLNKTLKLEPQQYAAAIQTIADNLGDTPIFGANLTGPVSELLKDFEKVTKELNSLGVDDTEKLKDLSSQIESIGSDLSRYLVAGVQSLGLTIADQIAIGINKNKNKILETIYGGLPSTQEKQVGLKQQELVVQQQSLDSERRLFEALTTLEATIAVTNAKTDEDTAEAQSNLSRLKQVLQDPVKAIEEFSAAGTLTPSLIRAGQQAAGFTSKQLELDNNKAILNLQKEIAKVSDTSETRLKNIAFEEIALKIKRDTLETSKLDSVINKARLSEAQRQLELADNDIKYKKENIDIQKEYLTSLAYATALEKQGKTEDAKSLRTKALALKVERENANTTAQILANKTAITNETKRNLDLDKSILELNRQVNDITQTSRVETEDVNLSLVLQRLEGLKQIGAIEESTYITKKLAYDLEEAEIKAERERYTATITAVRNIQEIQDKINLGGLDPQELELLKDQQGALAQALGARIDNTNREKDLRTGILKITAQQAEADAKRAEEAKKLNEQYTNIFSSAKLIGEVFDGFGDRFAETIGGLQSILEADIQRREEIESSYNTKRLQAAEKYKDNEVQKRQELTKIEQKRYQDLEQLDEENTAKVLGSTKKLFKEKTFAFKALSSLEKASAVQTLALNAQTIASNIASMAAKVSAGIAQMFAQGGFAGFAGAAGFLGLLASLGVFKGKSKVSSGPSTQQLQEAQLTGQSYVGNTLTTRAGALEADPTAKLESIDQSLSLIETHSFDSLSFSNKSQKSLEKIEQNTRALAEQISLSLGGLSSNLPVGTRATGPFGFGNSIVGKGASLAAGAVGSLGGFIGGTMAAGPLASIVINTLGTAIAGSASALTGIITSALGPIGAVLGLVLGKNIDKVLNSVFGGKTTSTLKNVTLQLEGSLNSLSSASDEFISTFATLEIKRKGGWFSSDRIWDEIIPTETPDVLREYVGTLFMSIKDSVISAGETLGQDVSSVLDYSLKQPIQIALKDLKPEEIVEAIKNQTSIAFNEVAKAGFGNLISALRDPLEEAGTTLTRLTAQSNLFTQAMKLLGKNVEDITGTLKVVVADNLIELAGGIESFKEKTTFFTENFLSESEQIAPIAEELAKELNALGISADITRSQYKDLVLQQNLTTDSGRANYVALLNLAEAFDRVTSSAEQTQEKLNGFLKSIRDFIKSQSLELVSPTQTTRTLFQEFGATVSKALAGDEDSLSYLPDIASQTVESARNSSSSLREFNKLRAGIIGGLGEVANKIESGDLKILSPQEQANEYLKQIAKNTAQNYDLTTYGPPAPSGVVLNAMGSAFNKGIKMFAGGGAFSNSVVNNPTMFPLGVMGEAGPEAIMPLTRTSDGSLGVTAEIPVNNTNQLNLALLQEVKNLKKEMEKVRAATEVSATGTNKTYRLLDRITENGDALNVVVVTA